MKDQSKPTLTKSSLFQSSLSMLRERLLQLKEKSALIAFKTGTEVEDMGFDEIAFLRELSKKILPLHVKIGGAEARNDIRELSSLEVDCLIAPMIESPYALKNYIQTLKDILNTEEYQKIDKGINIETITSFQNLSAILKLPEISELSQVTAARTDLSSSMNLGTNSHEVLEMCSVICASCQKKGLLVSIGGRILPEDTETLICHIRPERINTRHMVLSVEQLLPSPESITRENLAFEHTLCMEMSRLFPIKKGHYLNRAKGIQERMQSQSLI